MWPISTAAQEVIRGPQAIAVRGTAYGPSGQQYCGLAISGGSVVDSCTSQVRRSATVYVADVSLWPAGPLDLLSIDGTELQIDYGISIPGAGVEWIPLIRGLLTDDVETIPATSQGLTLTLADRSQKVKDDRVTAPIQVGGTGTIVSNIQTLITGSYPAANVVDLTGDTTACPAITVQQDKWDEGVEVLASSIGAEVFCSPTGDFVIRYQPTLASNPVWRIDTGPRGILVSNQRIRSRSNVYNQVIAQGESSDGTAPVSATATDSDPTSPTFYGGPFGKKTLIYTSSALKTTAQCAAAAAAILARMKGMDRQYTLQTLTNPALQSGDVMQLAGSTDNALIIADSVTTPLDFTTSQQIISRAVVLPAGYSGSTS